MPYRILHIDTTMMLLNATSITTIALSWATEHLAGVGGFVVMLSVAILNVAKAYSVYKKAQQEDNKK